MADPTKDLPALPAERALKVLSGRWKAVILYNLFREPMRLSQLTRILPRASQKMIIQQLREMEQHQLVHREVFLEVPPRVQYTATELGRSLEPVIMTLCDWGRRHARALNEIDRMESCDAPPPSRAPRRSSGVRARSRRSRT